MVGKKVGSAGSSMDEACDWRLLVQLIQGPLDKSLVVKVSAAADQDPQRIFPLTNSGIGGNAASISGVTGGNRLSLA